MKKFKIIGGVLIAIGIIHALGCLVGKHFMALIVSVIIIGMGVFLFQKKSTTK